ncbi:MAG: hypothetical protein HYW90_04720 [Candidatus Sungbacteria bacterium]|nr:hypothetical protein [Candidatus Sungbacteria bacterium]
MVFRVEVSEAEKFVHSGFDNLKAALSQFIGELPEFKSAKDSKKCEELLSRELMKEIEEVEKRMEKEVEDVKSPQRTHKNEKR